MNPQSEPYRAGSLRQHESQTEDGWNGEFGAGRPNSGFERHFFQRPLQLLLGRFAVLAFFAGTGEAFHVGVKHRGDK